MDSLFVAGIISYPFTSSVNCSEESIKKIRHALSASFGKNCFPEKYIIQQPEDSSPEILEAVQILDFDFPENNIQNPQQKNIFSLIKSLLFCSQMKSELLITEEIIASGECGKRLYGNTFSSIESREWSRLNDFSISEPYYEKEFFHYPPIWIFGWKNSKNIP